MLTLKFFASLRDQLGSDEETVAWHTDYASVAGLKQALADRGEQWRMAVLSQTVLVAINQDMAFDHSALKDGDEVAFFPPVTGG